MNTTTLEILRTGTPHNQTLSPGITYLALCGNHPPVEFRISIEQYKFNRLVRLLRYDENEIARRLAIDTLQELITNLLDAIDTLRVDANASSELLHVRLIYTAKELGMLPFELSLTPKGFHGTHERPFLMNPQRLTTLTRELRQSAPKKYLWPNMPRILFIWAQPNLKVPYDDHRSKLIEALKPFTRPFSSQPSPAPDPSPFFTEIANASQNAIRKEILKAIEEKKPYTHVHILAHGIASTDENGEQFALALQKEIVTEGETKIDATDGAQLSSILAVVFNSVLYCPAVVTITACDSGNQGTPLVPGGSLAHYLHHAGIPCVFASQFPLTIPGSIKLTDCLYRQLLLGEDPRTALYYVRETIHSPNTHDWASLVAYARFPEDIDEQLMDVRLKIMLEAMKATNAWADHVLKFQKEIREEKVNEIFAEVAERLDKSISELGKIVEVHKDAQRNPERHAENLGLLGSAFKRKSEHLYRMSKLDNVNAEKLRQQSRASLERSAKYYRESFEKLPSAHWTATQYLSIMAVLNGTLEKQKEAWQITHFMALRDWNNNRDFWALGTLAELYLLKPLIYPAEEFNNVAADAIDQAGDYIEKLNQQQDDYAKETTARQIERYIYWWNETSPFETIKRLKEPAIMLRKKLP